VVLHYPSEDTKTISECIGHTTNQRAELTAAIYALEEAHPDGHVKVLSDSNSLDQSMNGRWRRKKNLDLFSTLDDLVSRQRSVEFLWDKRHSASYHGYVQDLVEQAYRDPMFL
jgi:ribonuclease HI